MAKRKKTGNNSRAASPIPSLAAVKKVVHDSLRESPVDININNIPNIAVKDIIQDTLEAGKVAVKDVIGSGTGFPVELRPPGFSANSDFIATWDAIDKTKLDFNWFKSKIDELIDGRVLSAPADLGPTSLLFNSQAYNLLKYAVTVFVRRSLGFPEKGALQPLPGSTEAGVLPFYEIILRQLNEFDKAVQGDNTGNPDFRTRLRGHRSELIWSYWHEEGMLVQTMNAIILRFQNKSAGPYDPLNNLELDTLRPLANVLFGYVQDQPHRLTISRRNYEYQYQYGIKLCGRAVPASSPALSRTNFIEAFHNLLYRCKRFYELLDDRTKAADAFPLLSNLQEINLLLNEGMHNQYNDLSLLARVEMLMEQWILSRPEILDFLRGKPMVAYKEPWMGAVDTMKSLQRGPITSVKFYHDLAEYGEDILLSLRFVPWDIAKIGDVRAWAVRYREPVQRYIHAYHAVTGVDIAADPVSISDGKFRMPSFLLQQKYQRDKNLKNG